MEITFEYSPLWLILFLPIVVGLVWWMYMFFRDGKDQYADWSRALRLALFVLRVSVFGLVLFLLLQPFIVNLINDEERPRLLLYADVSNSINEEDRQRTEQLFSALNNSQQNKFDVELRQFAQSAAPVGDSLGVNANSTNYELAVQSINEDFYNQNIGAIVIATDGVPTEGLDPRYDPINANAPLYALAMGDTTQDSDFEITEVLHNNLVYLGNEFETKVRLRANRLKGAIANVELLQNAEVIASKEVVIVKANQSAEVTFKTKASRVGLNQYAVRITSEAAETNLTNNTADFFVDVLDSRIQILILAKSPHPDIAAIKLAIESNDQYEVEVSLLKNWDRNSDGIDMAILHGIPTDANDLNDVKTIRDNKISCMAIVNSKISPLHFNRMDFGINIEAKRVKMDEVGGWINADFNLFSIPANDKLNRFPPLSAIFSDYTFTGESSSALYQRVGSIKADKPLLTLSDKQGWKRGVLLAEGWWHWRLFELMRNPNLSETYWTDKMMVKMVQYLAARQKRERLMVDAPRKVLEGENIKFSAEYYNQAFELITTAEVNLELTDSSENVLAFTFKPDASNYRLDLGSLPVGKYRWEASTKDGETRFTSKGEFTVVQNRAEFSQSVANHDLLEQWVSAYNGRVFYDDFNEIEATLQQLDTAKPVIHTTKEWNSIIDWKWLVFLIALLLSIEWFIRKYNGSY